MASIDMQQFLWSTKAQELGGGQSVASFSPPLASSIRESREALSFLPYAKASADPNLPRPPVLAALSTAPHPDAPPVLLRRATFANAQKLKASIRSVARFDEGPARFGLPLPVAERAGWRVPRSLQVSLAGRGARQPEPQRLAALMHAPIRQPAATAYEIATADVDSIRWSIPGLDTFMRFMTPVWGTSVSPPQALQAAAAMAVVLMMATLATLQRAIAELRFRPGRAPLALASLSARARRHLRTPPQSHLAANVTLLELDGFARRSETLLIRTTPRASVIAHGLRVDGTVESSGTVVVSGQVFGDCRCRMLVIEAGGRVEGNIDAVRVEIRGRFKGAVNAAALFIDEVADIEGDIVFTTNSHAPEAQAAFAGGTHRFYTIAAE